MVLDELDHLDDETRNCIDACFEAIQACEWCADECIEMGDEEMTRCIRLCRDVTGAATLLIQYIARTSNYTPELAEVCAGTAEECAEECARHDVEHCQVCAAVLRDCAEACRNMMSTINSK